MKQKPVILKTPPLTLDELAKALGISKTRRAKLEKIVRLSR